MTYVSQKTMRAALVTSLKTITLLADESPSGLAHVVGYFQPNPQGISPFACVDSSGMRYDLPNDETGMTQARFVIGVWVRRDDPATAEDQLDDLALSIANVLRQNYPNARFTDYPQIDYEEIDGMQYKFALHFVEIDS